MSPPQTSSQANLREGNGLQVDAVELNQLVVELTGLLESAVTQEEFFVPYLERILEVTKATGVAIWQRHAVGHLELLHDFNFASLNLDQAKNGAESHALILEDALLTRRATWSEPTLAKEASKRLKANPTPFALLLVPIHIEDKTVGLLELFFPPDHERQTKRTLIRLATEVVGFAAAFLHKRQWKALQDERQVWRELETFAAQIHQGLDPRVVAVLVANDGKRLVTCDQLSVAHWQNQACEVLAISGAVTIEQPSPLVKAMRALLEAVCSWGETLTFRGERDESLPPQVLAALDTYLALCNSRLLIALPLKHAAAPCGVLLAESFGAGANGDHVKQRLECVARHASSALGNALEMSRLPLQWLTRSLASFRAELSGRGRLRLSIFAGVLIACSAFLAFFPLPLKSEATGELVPVERRIVYAPFNGKIVHLAMQHGDRVDKGQELLFIEDLDTQLKVDQLSVKIASANEKLRLLEEHLSKALAPKEQAEYLNDRIRTQYELNRAKVERDLLTKENTSPRKAPVFAPVAGQVLTFDAREKLLGKSVKPGDPLLRLGATSGSWEVELFIPEKEAARVRAAIANAAPETIEVDLLLVSDPARVYRGKLGPQSLAGETTVRNDKIVLGARVAIADPWLLDQLHGMPVGVEVHARIRCGSACAGYVWFDEIWNFLYERLVF